MDTDNADKDYKDIQLENEQETKQTDTLSLPVPTTRQCVLLQLCTSHVLVTRPTNCLATPDPPLNVEKSRIVLMAKGSHESQSKKAASHLDREFLPWPDAHS